MKAYNYLKPQVQCLNFLHCEWKIYARLEDVLTFYLILFYGHFLVIMKYVTIMRKNTSRDNEFFFLLWG